MFRLCAGILEGIGATTSSKDASFEADTLRFKRLEESLQKINAVVLTYLTSLKKSCEDAREVLAVADFYSSSDVKHLVRARTHTAVKFLDAVEAGLRVHQGIKTAVVAAIEKEVMQRLITPIGLLLRDLPALKKHMDTRVTCLTGERCALPKPLVLVCVCGMHWPPVSVCNASCMRVCALQTMTYMCAGWRTCGRSLTPRRMCSPRQRRS